MSKLCVTIDPKTMNITGKYLWQEETSSDIQAMSVQEHPTSPYKSSLQYHHIHKGYTFPIMGH